MRATLAAPAYRRTRRDCLPVQQVSAPPESCLRQTRNCLHAWSYRGRQWRPASTRRRAADSPLAILYVRRLGMRSDTAVRYSHMDKALDARLVGHGRTRCKIDEKLLQGACLVAIQRCRCYQPCEVRLMWSTQARGRPSRFQCRADTPPSTPRPGRRCCH